MEIALAALSAAVLAWLAPSALARLPEPGNAAPDKISYRELARAANLRWWLALGGGAMAGFAAWQLEDIRMAPVWVLISGVAGLLAYIDFRTHLLPYLIVAPLYGASFLAVLSSAWWIGDWAVLCQALVGNVVVFAIFVLLYVIAARFFRGGFGYGDVRLSAVLGLALGPLGSSATFIGIYAGFALGALAGVVMNRGRIRGGAQVAFGPFMLVGALAGLIV